MQLRHFPTKCKSLPVQEESLISLDMLREGPLHLNLLTVTNLCCFFSLVHKHFMLNCVLFAKDDVYHFMLNFAQNLNVK